LTGLTTVSEWEVFHGRIRRGERRPPLT
jgi:hypothetical protein